MADDSQSRFLQAAVQRGLISSDIADDIARRADEKNTVVNLLVQEGYLTQHLVNTIAAQLDQKDEPTSIAKFKILSKLGQGGMGTVYRAMQLSMQRQVALKVIAPQYAVDKAFCERFIREARMAGQLNHQNVITCYDVGQDKGYLYMALELVIGGDAAQAAIREGGRMNQQRAFEVIADCANGLTALKRSGLIHRDIKPANIFITEDGIAKLADLGLARSCSASSDRMTVTGSPMGTPAFMSPEQASGLDNVDIRTDIYSLGASLFALLTGEAPYKGTSAWDVVAQVLKDPVPDPRNAYRGVSDHAAAIIMKAMAKDRNERYVTPEDLIEDLDLVAAGKSPRHARPVAPIQDTWSSIAEPAISRERQAHATVHGFEPAVAAAGGATSTEAIDIAVDRKLTWPWTFTALVAAGIWIALAPSILPKRHSAEPASSTSRDHGKRPDGSVEVPLHALSQTAKTQSLLTAPEKPITKEVKPAPSDLAEPKPIPLKTVEPEKKPEPVAPVPVVDNKPKPSPVIRDTSSAIVVSSLPVDPEDEAEARERQAAAVKQQTAERTAAQHNTTKPIKPESTKTTVDNKPEPEPQPVKVVPQPTPTPAPAKIPDAQMGLVKLWQNRLDEKRFECVVQPTASGKVAITKVNPAARDFSALHLIPVESLDLSGCLKLDSDLSFLNTRELKSLNLRGCRNLKSLRGLEGAPLTELNLSGCKELSGDLSILRAMKLTKLDLSGCASLKSLDGLQLMPLTDLDLSGCESITPDLSPLKGAKLQRLVLRDCAKLIGLDGIAGMPLTELDCSGCKDLLDLIYLERLPLTKLSLKNCKRVATLEKLKGMPLTELELEGCESLRGDLSDLQGMKLKRLTLAGCKNLTSLNGIQGMPLTELDLSRCSSLRPDLAPLRGMQLTYLNCSYCSSLVSLEGLQSAPLKRLVLTHAGKLDNRTAIAGIKGLQPEY
jgi:hypothetical protein